jgi:hypothetical protein
VDRTRCLTFSRPQKQKLAGAAVLDRPRAVAGKSGGSVGRVFADRQQVIDAAR